MAARVTFVIDSLLPVMSCCIYQTYPPFPNGPLSDLEGNLPYLFSMEVGDA